MEKKEKVEYVDVLDEYGVKTGEIVTRDEAHRLGKPHRAIIVVIVNGKNEILIQKRAKTKKKRPEMWDVSVAGHVSSGKDSVSAAMQEVSEEVEVTFDWDIAVKDFRFMFSYMCVENFEDGTIEHQIYDAFIIRVKELTDVSKIKFQEEEVEELRLVSTANLRRMMKRSDFVQRPIWDWVIDYLCRY